MSFSERIFWPQLQTVVWLDISMPRLLWHVIVPSWLRLAAEVRRFIAACS